MSGGPLELFSGVGLNVVSVSAVDVDIDTFSDKNSHAYVNT